MTRRDEAEDWVRGLILTMLDIEDYDGDEEEEDDDEEGEDDEDDN